MTAFGPPHLKPEFWPVLALDESERMAQIRTVQFIEHQEASRLMRKLQRLYEMPKRPRMPGLLIAGPSFCGKTTLALEFLARHPREDVLGEDASRIPVAFANAPTTADLEKLFQRILDGLGCPDLGQVAPGGTRRQRILTTARKVGLQVMFIDEIHNALNGSANKQRTMLTEIKELSNDMKVCIVLLGTQAAVQFTSVTEEIATRFPADWLPVWEHGPQFRGLLKAFGQSIPLRQASDLPALSERLYEMCEGSLGQLAELLELAATRAIRGSGRMVKGRDGEMEVEAPEECITDQVLDDLDWIRPSKRLNSNHRPPEAAD